MSTTATLSYGGSATLTCQAYVYATSPGIVPDSVLATVTATPSIAMSAATVGAGLQWAWSGQVGASNHGGVTVRVTSAVTATATGFVDSATTASVVAPTITFGGLPTSVSVGSADQELQAQVGALSNNSLNTQNVRAGGVPITVTFTSSAPSVATLVTNAQTGGSVTVTIPIGLFYSPGSVATGGVALDRLAVGETTVSVAASGYVTRPGQGTVVVTITP